mmetsp:Transcript_25294/g.43207  ORF Transcript_25294/g.43207 Transcript_25294/m.43207 type:complete len:111 (+) Transcript_25294:241-573(+)
MAQEVISTKNTEDGRESFSSICDDFTVSFHVRTHPSQTCVIRRRNGERKRGNDEDLCVAVSKFDVKSEKFIRKYRGHGCNRLYLDHRFVHPPPLSSFRPTLLHFRNDASL